MTTLDALCTDVFLGSLLPFLNVRDLGNLACVSQSVRIMADDNAVWRRLHHGMRKKTQCIVSTSVHCWPRNWSSCQRFGPQLPRGIWMAAGVPCDAIHHYTASSLGEVSKPPCVNYKNFKRAYAKMVLSRLGKFTNASERHLRQLEMDERECYTRLVRIQEEKDGALKRKHGPAKFRAILALPPSTPAHLKPAKKCRIR